MTHFAPSLALLLVVSACDPDGEAPSPTPGEELPAPDDDDDTVDDDDAVDDDDTGIDDDDVALGDAPPCAGALVGAVTLLDVATRVVGEVGDDLGAAVEDLGDSDGNGLREVAVGAAKAMDSAGAVLVFEGDPAAWDGASPVRRIAGTTSRLAGFHLAAVGDTDGDGESELAISAPFPGTLGAPPTVFVHSVASGAGGDLHAGNNEIQGSPEAEDGGFCPGMFGDHHLLNVAGGKDLDGDGVPDLVVGASGAVMNDGNGGAYVYSGPLTGLETPGTADAVLGGVEFCSKTGWQLDSPGDLDGDGFNDLLIGSWGWEPALYVVRGPVGGSMSLADSGLIYGSSKGHAIGNHSVSGGTDLTGDGAPDIVVAASGSGLSDRAAVHVLPGAGSGSVDIHGVGFRLFAERAGSNSFALDARGDFNGDGFADLLMGVRDYLDPVIDWPGAVYVQYGPITNDHELASADLMLLGGRSDGRIGEAGERAGWSVAFARDLTGDGIDEIVIGAPDYDGGPDEGRGAVYVVPGRPCSAE